MHTAPWQDFAVELCDGRPLDVQSDVSYWVNTVGYFCPWSGKVTAVEDLP